MAAQNCAQILQPSYPELSPCSLIDRAKEGDRQALDQLLAEHRDTVRRIVYRTIGSDVDIEDVVQEASIQVVRSIGNFRGDARFTSWLYRLVSNVAKMFIRAKRSPKQLASTRISECPWVRTAEWNPEDSIAHKERMEKLNGYIAKLSEKKRTVLLLHAAEGLTAAQIAEIVNVPLMTVRTRLFYARKELKKWMNADFDLRDLACSDID